MPHTYRTNVITRNSFCLFTATLTMNCDYPPCFVSSRLPEADIVRTGQLELSHCYSTLKLQHTILIVKLNFMVFYLHQRIAGMHILRRRAVLCYLHR